MKHNYYTDFINFFKKHNLYDEEIFNYINKNSTRFEYDNEELIPFIGCYYIKNSQDILQKIKLYVPYITNQITVLINIHEYIHAIELYKKIGKKFKEDNLKEILPMLYERIYIKENPSKKLEEHLKFLNKKINENSTESYKIALEIQDELLDY